MPHDMAWVEGTPLAPSGPIKTFPVLKFFWLHNAGDWETGTPYCRIPTTISHELFHQVLLTTNLVKRARCFPPPLLDHVWSSIPWMTQTSCRKAACRLHGI
jgi:hypothetical protein